jgi:hypothetical protein
VAYSACSISSTAELPDGLNIFMQYFAQKSMKQEKQEQASQQSKK